MLTNPPCCNPKAKRAANLSASAIPALLPILVPKAHASLRLPAGARGESDERELESGARRHRHDARVRLVAPGLPSGRLRAGLHREGRKARQGRRRPRASHHPRETVPKMPCPERNGLPRRPHPAPLGARSRRPRQGRLEGNHLGRRARPHRRERQQNQGGLRPRIHRGHAGHGTRGRLVCVRLRVFRPGNPERPVHHERLFLLRPPHGRGGLHAWRRLSRIGLCGLLPRPLRRPPLRNPEVHRDLGQESAVFERRRLFRPCDHRPDEARLEADHRGSPRHLASCPFRIPPGAPARARTPPSPSPCST